MTIFDIANGYIEFLTSKPLALIAMLIYLLGCGVRITNNLLGGGYLPTETNYEEDYEENYEEDYEEDYEEEPIPPTLPKDFKTQLKTGEEAKEFLRKLNHSICPVCNAPVDNSRDTCKYCGSLYIYNGGE